MKLSDKQKEILIFMRKHNPMIMRLRDGYFFTGGHGKVDARSCNALRNKKLIGNDWKLSELGKTIQL